MITSAIPKRLDPVKLADQQASFQGLVGVSSLPRVAEVLGDRAKEVAVTLHFSRDEQYHCVIQGQLAFQARVTCERCLKEFEQELHGDFQLCVVTSDDAAREIPRDYDPLIVDTQFIDVADILEDEVLLALPMFSYHADQDCEIQLPKAATDASGEPLQAHSSEEKVNPFKVLSTLKLQK